MHYKWLKLLVLFWVCLVFVLIFLGLCLSPEGHGDGHEYALQLEAFANHFSPDIQVTDIDTLTTLVNQASRCQFNGYDTSILKHIARAVMAGVNADFQGIYKSFSDKYYSCHFWFYALTNLPAKFFLKYTGLNELKAFTLTNALLIIVALGYVLFFSRQSLFTRLFLSTLFLLSGTLYYFKWGTPEIYSATLILIAVIACLDSRYIFSILCAALGSFHPPPIALFIPMVLIKFFYNYRALSIKQIVKLNKTYLTGMLLVSSITFLPIVFYLINFGRPSLIAAYVTDTNYITISRFYSFLFDLNQGMIVAIPGVFIGAILLIIYRLVMLFYNRQSVSIFNFPDLLILFSIIIIIPCLSTLNFNSGCSVFMRYAYWAQVPLLVWITMELYTISGKLKYGFATIIFSIQIIVNLFLGVPVFKQFVNDDQCTMKPYIAFVFDNAPWLYNPEPEIFIERVLGEEKLPLGPVTYLNSNGYMCKILVSKADAANLNENVCGPGGVLIDKFLNKRVSLTDINFNYNYSGIEWGYLSGSFYCAIQLSHAIKQSMPILYSNINTIRELAREYYCNIVGVEPDPTTLTYLTSNIVLDMCSVENVREGFVMLALFLFNSPEYLNKETSDDEFVTDLYHTLLRRDPDSAGLSYWVEKLSCSTRNMLIMQFANSDEFKNNLSSLFETDTLGLIKIWSRLFPNGF